MAGKCVTGAWGSCPHCAHGVSKQRARHGLVQSVFSPLPREWCHLINPMNLIQRIHHRHVQKFVSEVNLDPVRLSVLTTTLSVLEYPPKVGHYVYFFVFPQIYSKVPNLVDLDKVSWINISLVFYYCLLLLLLLLLLLFECKRAQVHKQRKQTRSASLWNGCLYLLCTHTSTHTASSLGGKREKGWAWQPGALGWCRTKPGR